ncbi:MAG: alpha-2-macroglobulin family protein [Hyphomonadaceae bacterium]|nr:alpha-2-macroglobulin family protein [Hyphomonadaceae bacterium]
MSAVLRVLSCLVALLAANLVHAQDAPFTHAGVQADAKRYEAYLKANWQPGNRQGRDLRAEGNRLLAAGADFRAASRAFAQAVVFDANDAEAWTGLARALLAIRPDQGSERYELPVNASGAAWTGYARAQAPAAKSAALWVLHEAFKRRSYWRPAIDALKAGIAVNPTAEAQEALEKLVAEHGFRIAEYKVDTDAAQPRLCIQFSERLAPGTVDWAQYFKVNGKDPQGVNAEARQICLDGFGHGKRYEVQVKAGLPSAIRGETLITTAELAVYVKDRSASVRATGRGYVLPNRGQQGIPLVTVNTEKVYVEVYRIGDRSIAQALQSGDFQKQISSYDISTLKTKSGVQVYAGEMAVALRLNEDVTTAFPVAEAIPRLEPGVYVLAAHASERRGEDDNGRGATQWFIVSDLGLTAINGDDGIHGFVRSLASATAVVNANVRLLARNNEVLGTAKTDSRGYVRFDPGLRRGEGGQAPAVLVAETPAGDYAFLDLSSAAFDLTDRGVKGRIEPGPVDAFAYTDRGVYRPGESVHVTSLVRTRTGAAAPVPVTLIVSRPDGVEHSRQALTDQGFGGRAMRLALATSAMTGTWRVKVHTDPKASPIAQAAFLVEDFVPERLELKLEAAAKALSPQEQGVIKVAGRYLYGPPAAGLNVEGEISVRPSARDVPGFPGFRFGLADEQLSPVRKPLDKLAATSADGKADLAIDLPALTKTSRPLEADVIVRLRESGGRTIERTISLPVDMKSARIGIKPLFKDGTVGEGDTASFETIMLGPDGKAVEAKGLKWELLRLDQRWQWYSRDGAWAFEPVTSTRRVASGVVDAMPGTPAKIEARAQWGRYRLEVSDATGLISSMLFNAGYWADEGADSPEVLDVALDKPSYRVGDTARIRITSRAAGRALIAVLNSGLVTAQEADVPAGGGEVAIRVGEGWNPGAYITVALYRPMDEKAKRMPSRAMGLRWLAVDQAARTLGVTLDVPEKVKSGSLLVVPVKLTGLAAGEAARVTVAATDVGILNLTRFEVPKPDAWFFGQRRLGSEIRDLYGRLIDGMRAERGRLRSGGDGGGGMAIEGSPPVEATLALFSGIVEVAADGTAKVEFQLPDFNGQVRLTAVAWSADKVGSGSKDVIVRDAIALTVSAPRFLTLGDAARLELTLHNVEGEAGVYTVNGQYESEAGAQTQPGFERSVAIAAGERKRESFQLKPGEVGLTRLAVRVTGPGGIDVRRTLTFDVKVPAGDIRRLSVVTLAPKGGKLTLSRDLVQDLIPRRTSVTVTVGPQGALDLPGLLASLDRYPYGCAEQTTSRALPLLYVNDVAKRIGLASDTQVRERIDGAIARVLEMQDASGAFGIWGPSDGDMWLSSYVTDFLTRAREAGYAVRKQAFDQALDRLANYISYVQDFEKGGEARAYALYVLARNGRAPIGELRYYVDTRLDNFATPLAQAQLGAALAMMGDKPRAERALKAAFKGITGTDDGDARRDYGTAMRDGAALITLASETGLAKADVPRMLELVSKAYASKAYTSTQEQAWMVLAARSLADEAKRMALTLNGQPHQGQLVRGLTPADLQPGSLTIANAGDAPAGAVVSVIGAALTPEPAIAKGFTIERTYYAMDGRKIDLKSAAGGQDQLKQNERLVVVLKVEAAEAGGRILLVDRLPAGLEIENPRLVDSGDIKSLGWLKTTLAPQHTEFRDDRFVAAFDFFGSSDGRRGRRGGDEAGEGRDPASSAMVAYIVRAVTPGTYVHPAATVEDMYRADRFARTAAGRLEIVGQQ